MCVCVHELLTCGDPSHKQLGVVCLATKKLQQPRGTKRKKSHTHGHKIPHATLSRWGSKYVWIEITHTLFFFGCFLSSRQCCVCGILLLCPPSTKTQTGININICVRVWVCEQHSSGSAKYTHEHVYAKVASGGGSLDISIAGGKWSLFLDFRLIDKGIVILRIKIS